MDFLEKYGSLLGYSISEEPIPMYTPPPVKKRKYVVPKATRITLADNDDRSRDLVTAHNLKDYRRTSFNLVLLPSIELSYDVIAREVYGLGEFI